MPLTVILPHNAFSEKLRQQLVPVLPPDCQWRHSADDLHGLQGQRLLFAIALDEGGCNVEYYRLLSVLRQDNGLLEGCLGAVVVTGEGELYTKDVARDMVLGANLAGCAFMGRPLVEATGSLRNFQVQAHIRGTDEQTAFHLALEDLVARLLGHPAMSPIKKLLALHASVRDTSNTLAFWELAKTALPDTVEVTELCLRNGTIDDCQGCPYTACLHFGEKGRCFYGGPMVAEVFPAVRECDALMMLCANYNDALAANLTAFINRLTALYRQGPFSKKKLYAMIVSGYSGGDLIARQLISALNMNKSFYLPPRFCILETANEKGSLRKLPGIEEKGREFLSRILH